MPVFKIKHGFALQSAGGKLLTPNTVYTTDKEAELKEIREVFADAVEEVKQKVEAPKEPEKSTVDPEDDVTLVDGVGAGLSKKLAALGITTKSGLKAAMTDKSREEEMKSVLGNSYQKILDQFVSTPEE